MTVIIPDPGLTLSEALNVEGTLRLAMKRSRSGGDAVLASAAEKLVTAARQTMQLHPEEFEAVQAEIAMRGRFGEQGG